MTRGGVPLTTHHHHEVPTDCIEVSGRRRRDFNIALYTTATIMLPTRIALSRSSTLGWIGLGAMGE